MLEVTTAATDPTLLTLAETAEAIKASVTTANRAMLRRLNERASELLAGACGLERAGAAVLTLREETLTETVSLRCHGSVLFLSRKPIVEVLSVTEDGTDLVVDDDFEQDSERSLKRLLDGSASTWVTGKTLVSYRAGFATVPPGLKELAAKLVTTLNAERGRDPSLGSEDIPGVRSYTLRYGRPDDPLLSAEIMEGLRDGQFLMPQSMVG